MANPQPLREYYIRDPNVGETLGIGVPVIVLSNGARVVRLTEQQARYWLDQGNRRTAIARAVTHLGGLGPQQ
jgi:ribosomal protein S16